MSIKSIQMASAAALAFMFTACSSEEQDVYSCVNNAVAGSIEATSWTGNFDLERTRQTFLQDSRIQATDGSLTYTQIYGAYSTDKAADLSAFTVEVCQVYGENQMPNWDQCSIVKFLNKDGWEFAKERIRGLDAVQEFENGTVMYDSNGKPGEGVERLAQRLFDNVARATPKCFG